MTLRLYDTMTRSVRDFTPRRPDGVVTIYLCGPTVQKPPHIGHVRGAVDFDVLRRWLLHNGHDVVFCRNVTDIEDKLIAQAATEGVPIWQVAYRNERVFGSVFDALGCLPPTVEPRATGHMLEISALIQRLIDGGHAYAAGGDVYFDVASWPSYGKLSGQKPDNVQPADDTDPAEAGRKRDPRDFALWKSAKEGEPTWPSPFGPGRPGWHIECSAMIERYLGGAFDIHGGGMDLMFPHHENEIAQSNAAGDDFAAFWVHNGLVTTAGEKMSKSMGNSMLVTEVLKRVRPAELRYYLVAPHYRSVIEASLDAIDEAAVAYRRLESFVVRATEVVGEVDPAQSPVCADFAAAMDDNLGVPGALAAIHEVVRDGNKALADGAKETVRGALGSVRAMLGVLGLDPLAAQWRETGGNDDLTGVVDSLVAVALEQRQAARARKDFAAADTIRDQLTDAGIAVEDTRDGARWTLRDAR